MFKKLFIVVAAMGIYFSAVAQNIEGVNARLDAMAGIGVISDIGWTIDKPSALYCFPDHIQGSVILKPVENVGKVYGAIVAIKSIGEHTFVGLTFNGRRAMPSNFYDKFATGFAGFDDLVNAAGRYFTNIPRLNVGFKFNDNFTGGIGTFVEATKRDFKNEIEYFYSANNTTNTVTYDSTIDSKYFGIGFNVDARIWTGPIKINPELRFFIPSMERTHETNLVDKIKATGHDITEDGLITSESDNGGITEQADNMFFRAGSKVSGTIQEKLFWIVGYWYKMNKYRFKRDRFYDSLLTVSTGADVFSTGTDQQTTWQLKTAYNDLWIGLQPLFNDNLVLGIEYSGSLMKYTPTHETFAMDSTYYTLLHTFRVGAERSVKGFWCFEEFTPRFGLKYNLFKEYIRYNNNPSSVDTTNYNEYLNSPWSSSFKPNGTDNGKGLKVTAGFGLKGKRGTLDISLDLLQWFEYSVLTGPSAALVTYTLDFGRKE